MATSNSSDFVCRNGLVVGSNIIWASILTPGLVGIGTGTPDATLKVAGTANVSGNAAISAPSPSTPTRPSPLMPSWEIRLPISSLIQPPSLSAATSLSTPLF